MTFNFSGLVRFLYLWLTRVPWTLRRLAVAVAFCLLFPVLEFLVWTGLAFDHVFYGGFRRQKVQAPVFIVGNPRSGTTFLHRLLARDERFCTMTLWEILFAPSIVQRRVVGVLAAVERRLGGLVRWLFAREEQRWKEVNVMHEVSLAEPEEDDYLLLHIWSALTVGLSSGLLGEAAAYTYFDRALPASTRRRIFRFYRRCLQRHLYAHPEAGPIYLAKNPALCPKLESLFETFPDARVIYLVRSPLEMVPSYLNMMEFSWRAVGVPIEGGGLREYLLDMARHWYQAPLERLDQAPPEQACIVRYPDLVSDPEGTVRTIYRQLGLEIEPAFAEILRQRAEQARAYRSRHDYGLEELSLSRDGIVETYREVFERFDFDRGA